MAERPRAWRSIRAKVLASVLLVVSIPALWVFVGGLVWSGHSELMEAELDHGMTVAGAAVHGSDADLAMIARRHRMRIRLVRDGQVVFDHNGDDPSHWARPLATPFFGPNGRPDAVAWDADLGPLPDRDWVRAAGSSGVQSRCEVEPPGELRVCWQARPLDDGSVLVGIRSSVQVLRTLYEVRFALLALTLNVGIVGGLVAIWLGFRLVRPIEQLQVQVRQRTAGGLTPEPIVVDTQDEVHELATAFNALIQALASQNKANEAFAADLAHELKNPIAAVQTAAEALGSGRPVDAARAARLTRILQDASGRMEAVTHRFLELARAEAGLADQTRTPVELRPLVEGLVGSLQAQVDDVVVHIEGDAPAVPAASERIETVLRNLLTNALAYAPQGTGDAQVWVRLSAVEHRVRVVVEDSGPGIPAEDLDRVFERYFSRRSGGTGLGLALCSAIANAHGGSLRAENRQEGGARFVLLLPRTVAP